MPFFLIEKSFSCITFIDSNCSVINSLFFLHWFSYLIGCDNVLAKLHTRHPEACNKVGGVIIMHIDDLRRFAMLWLHKTEEVRADRSHWSKDITGDVYEAGWISEMYGYSFGAAEVLFVTCVINILAFSPFLSK